MNPNIQLIAFLALVGTAGAALATFLLNLGAERVIDVSPLDRPPQVVDMRVALLIGLGIALPLTALLWAFVTPLLSLLGIGVGAMAALAYRTHEQNAWNRDLTREFQSLLTLLIIQMESGTDSMYRALETAMDEGDFTLLPPILEQHVLAVTSTQVPLGATLFRLASARMLASVPLVQDAMASMADKVDRQIPVRNLVQALKVMDNSMVEITRLQQAQEAASAQTIYSAYIVAGLVVVMALVLVFMAPDLGRNLLYTVPGNITVMGVACAIFGAINIAQKSAETRPLRF